MNYTFKSMNVIHFGLDPFVAMKQNICEVTAILN